MCWNFIDEAEKYSTALSSQQEVSAFVEECTKGDLDFVIKGKGALSPRRLKILEGEAESPIVDIAGYLNAIEEVRRVYKTESSLSQLLLGVKSSRQSFIEKFIGYEGSAGEGGDCPLCGYSWKDAEELKSNFDKQSFHLEGLIKEVGEDLNTALETFKRLHL